MRRRLPGNGLPTFFTIMRAIEQRSDCVKMKALNLTHFLKRCQISVCLRGFCILSLVLIFGYSASGRGETNKDAEARYEPRSSPGSGQQFLEKFVGDWEVEKVFHSRTHGVVTTKGECHQALINGGRFLKSDFIFYGNGTNSTGVGLIGFEPDTGFFTSVWADSRSTKMSFRQSKAPFDGQRIITFSQALGNGGVREADLSRNETHLENNGRKIIHQQFVANTNGTERVVFELILTKKNT